MRLSRRVQAISPSPTMSIDARTKALIAEGADVINFSVGEPDFPTPPHICEAAIRAIRDGRTKYTPAGGSQELRQAVAEALARDQGVHYAADEIVISVGAKHSLYNIFQAILEPGDQVILQAPYWVSYPEQIRLAGGEPVILPTDESTGFRLAPEQLRSAISVRTRAVLLNSPSNPTGVVYPRQALRELVEVALAHDLLIVSDEIYDRLVYDGTDTCSVAGLGEAARAHTILVNGVSKAYSMTGWRIGYTAGDRRLVKAIAALQTHSTSNPDSIAQAAAVEALRGPQEAVGRMAEAFRERRDVMWQALCQLPGVSCLKPQGAFYCFPNLGGLLGRTIGGRRVETVDELCELILERARVSIVPGRGFGAPNNARFSYATSLEQIREGMARLQGMLG